MLSVAQVRVHYQSVVLHVCWYRTASTCIYHVQANYANMPIYLRVNLPQIEQNPSVSRTNWCQTVRTVRHYNLVPKCLGAEVGEKPVERDSSETELPFQSKL